MLAFIHIPKTGGQTITYSLLRSAFGFHHCDISPFLGVNGTTPIGPSDLVRAKKIYPSLQSIAGHSVMLHVDLASVAPDIQYFALVREPISQYLSHYNYRRTHQNPNMRFDEWLEIEEFHNHQTKMFAGNENVNLAIQEIYRKNAFIGLTEYFDESLVLFRKLYAPHLNIAYQKKNLAHKKNYAEDILSAPDTLDKVAERCQADLQLYTFIKNELFPNYQKQYGKTLGEDLAQFKREKHRVNQINIVLSKVYRNVVYKPVYWLTRRSLLQSASGKA